MIRIGCTPRLQPVVLGARDRALRRILNAVPEMSHPSGPPAAAWISSSATHDRGGCPKRSPGGCAVAVCVRMSWTRPDPCASAQHSGALPHARWILAQRYHCQCSASNCSASDCRGCACTWPPNFAKLFRTWKICVVQVSCRPNYMYFCAGR